MKTLILFPTLILMSSLFPPRRPSRYDRVRLRQNARWSRSENLHPDQWTSGMEAKVTEYGAILVSLKAALTKTEKSPM
jgi:hypothetical protein